MVLCMPDSYLDIGVHRENVHPVAHIIGGPDREAESALEADAAQKAEEMTFPTRPPIRYFGIARAMDLVYILKNF